MTKRHINLIELAQEGDLEARNTVAEEHLGIIGSVIVRRFMANEWGECWQAGSIGLLGAIQNWKPGRGDFAPYAWTAIYYKILDDVRRQPPPMVSLNEPVAEDGELRINLIPNERAGVEEIVIDKITAETAVDPVPILHDLLRHLSERDQLIVNLRFGLDGGEPQGLHQIGDHIGTTHQSIHVTLQKIYGHLARSPVLRSALNMEPLEDRTWVPGLKWCHKCKRNLPLENFGYRNKAKGTRKSPCKECKNAKDRLKYQRILGLFPTSQT